MNRGDTTTLERKANAENVNSVDTSGRPLLVHAVLAELGGPAIPVLLSAGADPNISDSRGWTALHFASRDDKPKAVSALLAGGASVDPEDDDGCTPLCRAVMGNASDETIRVLVGAGADPDKVDKSGSDSPRTLAELMERNDLFNGGS